MEIQNISVSTAWAVSRRQQAWRRHLPADGAHWWWLARVSTAWAVSRRQELVTARFPCVRSGGACSPLCNFSPATLGGLRSRASALVHRRVLVVVDRDRGKLWSARPSRRWRRPWSPFSSMEALLRSPLPTPTPCPGESPKSSRIGRRWRHVRRALFGGVAWGVRVLGKKESQAEGFGTLPSSWCGGAEWRRCRHVFEWCSPVAARVAQFRWSGALDPGGRGWVPLRWRRRRGGSHRHPTPYGAFRAKARG